jgi:hypothetical protein
VAPRSCRRSRAEAVEREGRGLWGRTGQRSLERSACRALLVIARKPAPKVRFWHVTDIPKYLGNVRYWVNSGKHVLALSFSGFDPTRTFDLIIVCGWLGHLSLADCAEHFRGGVTCDGASSSVSSAARRRCSSRRGRSSHQR